jgi:hypothetical protein
MAFNPLDYLKNLVPENTNMFGASPNANMEKMAKMGLLGDASYEDMLAKANKQSIFQGLLSSGLAYAAQPKNQGYGSIFPYLAKAGLAGVQAAQSPYDQMGKDAMMNQQLQEMQRQKEKQDLMSSLYPTKQVASTKQENIAPFQLATEQNYNVGSQLMGASPYEKAATSVAPDFGTVGVNVPQANLAQVNQLDKQVLEQIKYKYPEMYNSIISNQKIESEILLNKAKAGAEGIPKSRAMTAQEVSSLGLPTLNQDGTKAVWYLKDDAPINVSKSGSGQTINNIINPTEKAIGEDVGKVFIASQNQGQLASKNLADVAQMETLLAKANQGIGQGSFTDAKALASTLGIVDVDLEKLGSEQAARALSNQLAIALRPPASGVMTDKDFEVFLQSVPGINNTAEANKLMIAFAKDSSNRQLDLSRKLRDYKKGTVDAYGNTKKAGEMDDGIYEVVDKFWQDVAVDRKKIGMLKSGEIYGEPTMRTN